jgi:hypothetical protein
MGRRRLVVPAGGIFPTVPSINQDFSVAGRKRDVDEALIGAFCAGATAIDAAKVAKCSENTARRRLADPEFSNRLKSEKAALLERVIDRLASIGRLSADVLFGLLKSNSEKTRLGAAKIALSSLFRGKEVLQLSVEIEELKTAIAAIVAERESLKD